MKFLNPQPRYEATFAEVAEAIEFTPFSSGVPPDREGWLHLGTCRAGIGPTGGWYHFKFKPALIEMLAPSIYSNSPKLLHRELGANLIEGEDGTIRLFLQFQQIIGSYWLMSASKEETLEWLSQHKEAA